jgi:DNA-binding CsgD family transcriptional regulator
MLFGPVVRWPESPLGTFTRGGYHDYGTYLYSLARTVFPTMPEDEFDWFVRTWAGQVPEPVHRAYMALLAAADLSTMLPSIEVPVLVKTGIRSPNASKVAAMVPGSVLIERDYGVVGQRARDDWDEHIGSRFGVARKPPATVPHGVPTRAAQAVLAVSPFDAADRGLTAREREVLRLLAAAKTNREIAEHLVITENTAATHVRHVMEKTGAANRTEAAAWAIRNGLA